MSRTPTLKDAVVGAIIVGVIGGFFTLVVPFVEDYIQQRRASQDQPEVSRQAKKQPETPLPAAAQPPATTPAATKTDSSSKVAQPVEAVLSLPIAPTPKLACRALAVPASADSLSSLADHLCALAACGGEAAQTSLAVFEAWDKLATAARADACRGADRAALDTKPVAEAIDGAIKATTLPAPPSQRQVCREIQRQLFAELRERRDMLRAAPAAAPACGEAASRISGDVEAFLATHNLSR